MKDVNQHLYRTLQIAVRQTLGKCKLAGGIAILPVDIRDILNQVVTAERQAHGEDTLLERTVTLRPKV